MKTEPAVLLKLGGSIITDKGSGCVIREVQVEEIAGWIASRWPRPLAIIHGAGSCGHPEAHRYGIARGISESNREGVLVTHEAVAGLNDAVVKTLRRKGLPAIGIHPLHGMVSEDGRVIQPESRHISLMIQNGLLPVLHGDVVMDISRGVCIVSGDQLIGMLAEELHAGRIGLATDVDGVFCDGTVIPEINQENADNVFPGESLHTDVTGGMKGKMRELLALATRGYSSEIFHFSRIPEFLDGRPTGGTRISGGHG
jgi:isopentenyl phosphate kinase